MSTVKSKKLQVGTDATSSNNFTIYQPSTPDGTLRIGVGNADSPTEVAQFSGNGLNASSLSGNSELVPLAWVVCGNTDGTSETTIIASYGVSSVTDAEVGANYYNYSETQPSGTYRVIVASQDNSGWNAGRIMITGTHDTAKFRVRTWDAAGTNDDAQHHAIVFGETS